MARIYTPFQLANAPGSPYGAIPTTQGVYQSIAAQQTPAGVWMQDESQTPQGSTQQFSPIPEVNPLRMQLARQMMATGSSVAPVRSPLEGLARTLTGVAGGYFAGEANRAQQARDAAIGERIGSLVGLDPETVQGLGPEQALQVAQVQAAREPKAVETWRPLTPPEAAQYGVPEGVYQISSKGKVQPISKGGINVNVGTYDEEAMKARAKSDEAYRTEIRTQAAAARDQVPILRQTMSLLESGRFETGALGPAKLRVGQLLSAFGFDPEQLGLGDVATGEQLEAFFNKNVMSILNQYKGALSEGEREFAISQEGNIGRTPEANRALLKMAMDAARRTDERYSMARKWIRNYGFLSAVNENDQDFDDMWNAWLEEQGEGFEPPTSNGAEDDQETAQAGMAGMPEVAPSVLTEETDLGTLSEEQIINLDLSKLTSAQKKQWDKIMDDLGY